MNFRPELLAKVLAGEKTQTRRIKKANEYLNKSGNIVYTMLKSGSRVKWHLNGIYAAAPGRGQHGTCHFKLLSLREECAADISDYDARAEGFASSAEFFEAWDRINGKNKRNAQVWVLTFELTPDTVAEFRQGWHEAMTGQTLPLGDLLKQLEVE